MKTRAFLKTLERYSNGLACSAFHALMDKPNLNADQFWNWASDTFGRPRKTLRTFMEIAIELNEVRDENEHDFKRSSP